MNIKSYNKALSEQIKKALNFAFTKEMDPQDEEIYYCNDTDTVKYRTVARSHLVIVYFSCTDLRQIWNYAKQHLCKRHYPHLKVGLGQLNHGDALEIILDDQKLTIAVKQFGNKQETGITTGRKKFDAVFEYISKKLASIKRHFFASPFEMMLEAVAHNQKSKDPKIIPNLSFNIKPDSHERIWIVFQKNQFTVYYGISFDDRSEQQLCRIFFSELVDAKKHINNSPSVVVTESELPRPLVESFPEEKTKKYRFSNGIISFTLFGSLVRKPESMATFLANFRTYAYYHIQASKCYLHSRVLRRINNFHKDLSHSEIEPTVRQ